MNDDQRELLREHLDGSLPPERLPEVEELLARDDEARRFVAEHTWLWDALGDAYMEELPEASEAFRAETLTRAQATDAPPLPLRRKLVVAAGLLAAVGLFAWSRVTAPAAPALNAEEREVVRYLHVLRDFGFLEAYGTELDLRGDFDVMQAFSGELESEG